jgi:vancomycin resistance protein VanW
MEGGFTLFFCMSEELYLHILNKIQQFERPERQALSSRFPLLKRPILTVRQLLRRFQNQLQPIARKHSADYFSSVVVRHQSLLLRQLGDADMRLQRQKITNLRLAAQALDGLIIRPEEVFSLWEAVGKPSSDRGFVPGMLLSNGKVVEGVGGGLCQMANLLYWMFLHCEVEVVERYHHSRDVFPDSGRVLPFGSGATILYNFVDLKIKNTSDQSIQLKVWLTDKHLKGQIVSEKSFRSKFHITERNHYFVQRGGQYFRFNELWREEFIEGNLVWEEKVTTNFAPVLYSLTKEHINNYDFKVVDFSDKIFNQNENYELALATAKG